MVQKNGTCTRIRQITPFQECTIMIKNGGPRIGGVLGCGEWWGGGRRSWGVVGVGGVW